MENLEKTAAVQVLEVFGTPEHFDSRTVFQNRAYWALKEPYFSGSLNSEIFKL